MRAAVPRRACDSFPLTNHDNDPTMPNLAATLKQEIARLARREIRSEIQSLRKASAQFRRDIAKLKRASAEFLSNFARLQRQAGKADAPAAGAAEATRVRYTAKSVASHRRRLGLSAEDFGRLVGVTGHTIYQWEHGTSRPRRAQLAALASVRGLGKREARARLQARRELAPGKRRRVR